MPRLVRGATKVTKIPNAVVKLCEKIKGAAQLPSLMFVEPDAPYAISIRPTTYPVTTLIKLYDRVVGALGYREIYGQEIAAVFCFHVLPIGVSADQKSLDKFASGVADYLKAVDIALRLEQIGIPYIERLSKNYGLRPLTVTATTDTDTIIYLNPFNAFDVVPVGGYFSVVGYLEPVVKVYRQVVGRAPYGRELVGTIHPNEPLPPKWLEPLIIELYLGGRE
jgi:hypothetical protein